MHRRECEIEIGLSYYLVYKIRRTGCSKMKLKTLVFFAIFLGAGSQAWAAKPILNIEDESVPVKLDGSTRSIEEVRNAIAAGCRLKGWSSVIVDEAHIKCSILVRGKHYAEVMIPYTESEYSILYADSRDLDYDAERQRIHRNYNKWVILLSRAIQQQFTN
jgi:hypothetical protein